MAEHVAEKLWQCLEQNSERKAMLIIREIKKDDALTANVLHTEVNKIVFGKHEHFRDSITCLHLAAKRGMQSVLQEMIVSSTKLDINVPSSLLQWTALHYAVNGGHKHAVKALVKSGSNKNAHALDGKTPLHVAVQRGWQKVAGYLVIKDCNVHAQDRNGNTVLHYCLSEEILQSTGWSTAQRHEMVELLLIKGAIGAAKNHSGDSPLHWAVQNRVEFETVAMLIHSMEHAGQKMDILNSKGLSPLHVAHDPQTAGALIESGASVNLATTSMSTPLHLHVGNSDMVELLLHQGSNPNSVDRCGRSPLHVAVMSEVPNLWTIELLSSTETSLNATDTNLETPLHLVCHNKYCQVKVIRNNSQVTIPIGPASDPVIEILLKHGAKITVQNKKKQTPLLKALERRLDHKATILYLASDGAGCNRPDIYGRTAKTLSPKWYAMLQTRQEDKNASKGLVTVTEEEEEVANSDQHLLSNDSFEALTPLPNWVKGEAAGTAKRPRAHSVRHEMPCKLPEWVMDDYTSCKEDLSPDEGPSQSSKKVRKAPDTTCPMDSLARQVTSLQGDVDDFKDFLETFADEGKEEEAQVDCDVAELQGEVSSMRLFLEKFSEEGQEEKGAGK